MAEAMEQQAAPIRRWLYHRAFSGSFWMPITRSMGFSCPRP